MLYGDWAPTSFDSPGAFLPHRRDWHVVPVIQTRDSGALELSNFDTALRMLSGESETCEVHRFGHWGPGWFEIILVSPERAPEVDAIRAKLENYPVLDEDDWTEREYTRAAEFWASLSVRMRVEWCARAGVSLFVARRAELPSGDADPDGRLYDLLRED